MYNNRCRDSFFIFFYFFQAGAEGVARVCMCVGGDRRARGSPKCVCMWFPPAFLVCILNSPQRLRTLQLCVGRRWCVHYCTVCAVCATFSQLALYMALHPTMRRHSQMYISSCVCVYVCLWSWQVYYYAWLYTDDAKFEPPKVGAPFLLPIKLKFFN
jgi:hypothetical protein